MSEQICGTCGTAIARAVEQCTACGALQPLTAMSHFERLGLPIAYGLDEKALERVYFAAQRRLHPDRFAAKSLAERALSLRHATAVNEAYEVLNDPLARSRHMLDLAGRPLPGGDGRTINDPALLMEALEWREAIEEADGAEILRHLGQRLSDACRVVEGRIYAAFEAHDIEAAISETLRLAYLKRLEPDLRRRRASEVLS